MLKTSFLKIAATWFYSGLSPKAPGTCGSLATLPFVYALALYGGEIAVLYFAAVVFVAGIYISGAYAKILGVKDPGQIVIDETAGQSLTLVAAGTNPLLFALGFVLFRLFDITKPWPISWADKKVKGGLGIMLDDVFAGIISGVIIYIVKTELFI